METTSFADVTAPTMNKGGRPRKGFDKDGNLLPGWVADGTDATGKPKARKEGEQPGPGRKPPEPGGKAPTMDEEAAKLREQYKAAPGTSSAGNAPSLVTGYMFLILVDAIVPELIAMGLRRFAKRTDVKAADLRLSDEDRKQIEPLADAAAARLMAKADPVVVFLVAIVCMYAARIPAAPEKVAKTLTEKDLLSALEELRKAA